MSSTHRAALSCLAVLLLSTDCPATSWVRVGFSQPVVHNGFAYLSHPQSKTMICFDLTARSVRWRLTLDFPALKVRISPKGEVVAEGTFQVATLDASTGKTLRQQGYSRFGSIDGIIRPMSDEIIRAVDSDGHFFFCSFGESPRVRCVDSQTGTSLWEYTLDGHVYTSDVQVVDECVLVAFVPFLCKLDARECYIQQGPLECLALGVKDGSFLWHMKSGSQIRSNCEDIASLEENFQPPHRRIALTSKWLACAVGTDIRLIDRRTRKSIRACTADDEIRDVVTWRHSSLVLCTGALRANEKTIVMLGEDELDQKATFPVSAWGAVKLHVVDDILLIQSRVESHAVDLAQNRQLWTGPDRRYAVHDGEVYYTTGASRRGVGDESSFGVCDPQTGAVTVLYAETMK